MLYHLNSALYLIVFSILSLCLIDYKFSSNPFIDTEREKTFCVVAWNGFLLAILERFF